MPETIRQKINKIRQEVLADPSILTPDQIFSFSSSLSVLIGNLGDEMAKQEQTYLLVLEKCLQNNDKVNRAEIKAKTFSEGGFSPYLEWQKTKSLHHSTEELIRSLKRRLRVLEDEQNEHSKNI